MADSSLFEMFTFPVQSGDTKTALQDPNAVVITEKLAKKHFGAKDPIGRPLIFWNNTSYHVTGVLKQMPVQSHLTFDMVIPISSSTIANYQYDHFLEEWWDWSCYTYVLLQEGVDFGT